jgi:hypothetical protein
MMNGVMKYLGLVSLLLGLLLGVSVDSYAQVKNSSETSGLTGCVKSVELSRIEYALKDGKSVEGKPVPIQTIAFDEDGNKTEQVTYDRSGSATDRLVYTYDAAGRNTGYDEYSSIVDKSLSTARRHVYKLDDAGRTIEHAVFDSDGSTASRFFYKYDDRGNKLEELFYSGNGSRTGKSVNVYDGNAKLLSQTSYDADDNVSWKIVNSYDAEGRKTELVHHQGGILRYRITYKYDDKGRVKEEETSEYNAPPNVHTSHAPVPGKVVYAYDDDKRTKEVVYYNEDGSLKNRLVYAFDAKGNDAGTRTFNADGTPQNIEIHWYDNGKLLRTLGGTRSVKHEYDSHGNWTRKTHFIKAADADKPEPYCVESRTITYY